MVKRVQKDREENFSNFVLLRWIKAIRLIKIGKV